MQRQRVESLNNLSSFIYNLRDQIKDKEGLGGKLSQKNKQELSTAMDEGLAWIDQYGPNALLEDIEEKLAGKVFSFVRTACSVDMNLDIQTIVNPITMELYAESAANDSDDWKHVEL